jgi:hypothetical protein
VFFISRRTGERRYPFIHGTDGRKMDSGVRRNDEQQEQAFGSA